MVSATLEIEKASTPTAAIPPRTVGEIRGQIPNMTLWIFSDTTLDMTTHT